MKSGRSVNKTDSSHPKSHSNTTSSDLLSNSYSWSIWSVKYSDKIPLSRNRQTVRSKGFRNEFDPGGFLAPWLLILTGFWVWLSPVGIVGPDSERQTHEKKHIYVLADLRRCLRKRDECCNGDSSSPCFPPWRWFQRTFAGSRFSGCNRCQAVFW